MAFPELRRLGQLLSTRFVDRLVRVHRWLSLHRNPSLSSLQMLRCFVDLATRAIRLDLVKPRIKENDFNEVRITVDGLMNVENARFKTRIRASKQARHILRCTSIGVFYTRFNALPRLTLRFT
jgi:hypothetical protein